MPTTERTGAVYVRAGKGERPRTVPLPVDARTQLRRWLEERARHPAARLGEPALWRGRRGRLSPRQLQRIVTDLGAAAGLEVSAHTLRRSTVPAAPGTAHRRTRPLPPSLAAGRPPPRPGRQRPRRVAVRDLPDPGVQEPQDAVIRITTTNKGGSYLHMYEGRTAVEPSTVLSHENLGIVEEVGSGLTRVQVGDRVSAHAATAPPVGPPFAPHEPH